MIPLYAGADVRENVGLHVFADSVFERASQPVALCPLTVQSLQADQRDGSNAFTYSRFLIPFLQGGRGMAIFADGADMLCLADIAELWDLANPKYAVQVVKHDYKTKHPRKYIGTPMECDNADYPRKNWSSLMIVNCEHKAWRYMTPAKVAIMPGSWLHRFEFIEDEAAIGELPPEWNLLVGEQPARPDAKLVHFTLGIPAMEHYRACDYADNWLAQAVAMVKPC